MRKCPNCGYKEKTEGGNVLIVLEGDIPSRAWPFNKLGIMPHYWDLIEQKSHEFKTLDEAKAFYEKVLEFTKNSTEKK